MGRVDILTTISAKILLPSADGTGGTGLQLLGDGDPGVGLALCF